MLKDKRGFELGWQFIFSALIVLLIITTVVIFIVQQANGTLIQKQILAKEVCMLVSGAESGTKITIEHDKKITIEHQDDNIITKSGEFDRGYIYPCPIQNKLKFSQKGHFTIIEILENVNE